MFRKEPAGIEYWNEDYPAECANRQRHILTSALKMLKPGGTLVYSTCTFAPEEDEQMAAWLLNNYDLTMVELEKAPGMDAGRPEWADGNPELTKALRLFPHHFKGEGHFIAKFVKNGEEPVLPTKKNKKKKAVVNGVSLPPLRNNKPCGKTSKQRCCLITKRASWSSLVTTSMTCRWGCQRLIR